MKRWWSTFKTNSKKKRSKKRGEEELLRSRKNKWETTWQSKLKKSIEKKSIKKRLMRSKPKYGRKTQMPFLKTKKTSKNIWKEFIRNTNKCYKPKCRIRRISKIERKWIPLSFSITKPLWKQPQNNHRMLKRPKFDPTTILHFTNHSYFI